MADEGLLSFVGDIVAAHVSNNVVSLHDLPELIKAVHSALSNLDATSDPIEPVRKPAVSIRASVKPDGLVCLECGAHGKILKRHLAVAHDLTPEQYRSRWGLQRDYPMVAPNYSAARQAMAQKIGLGRKAKARKAASSAVTPASENKEVASTERLAEPETVSSKAAGGEVS